MRQLTLHGLGEEQENANPALDLDKFTAFAEKITSSQRAMTFVLRAHGDGASTALEKFEANEGQELFNALCMSHDDHVLAISELASASGEITVFSVLEERFLKRNLAAFSVNRPVRIFGRTAYFRREDAGGTLGVQPVSISLL